MPANSQPSISQVHIDAILTNISVAFMQADSHFIADKVFPTVRVNKRSDLYFTYSLDDFYRDSAEERADGVESVGSGYGLSTDNYSATVWALHKDIGDQTRANSDSPLDPDADATRYITQQLMISREKQFFANYFTTGVWGTDVTLAAADKWDVYTTSDPDIIDRIKYTTRESPTLAMMGNIFDIPRILVASSVENTANEGATGAFSFLAGKNALLTHSAMAPGLLTPSAGYNFAWTGISGTLGFDIGIKRFRIERNSADRIEGEIAYANKVVASEMGYFWNQAVT